MVYSTYIGPVAALKGKGALLREENGKLLAQFVDTTIYEGIGWHQFAVEDFCSPLYFCRLLELLKAHHCPGRPECSVCAPLD